MFDKSGISYRMLLLDKKYVMAKGKSQYCTWFCGECNRANYVTYYDKRRNDEIVKELAKFCPQCRKHVDHKRKDTKKGN